jgi:hypothetical protein
MMLAQGVIRPYYAQIELSDPTTPGYPDWGSGEEAVVATPTCIVVATRPDHLGDVEVEAWLGGFNEPSVGTPAWEGEFSLAGERAVIGSTVGNQFIDVPLGVGEYQVSVYTLPHGGMAERIVFALSKRGLQRANWEPR